MDSPKCTRCGFQSWVNAALCKRCGAPAYGARASSSQQFAPQAGRPGWVEVGLLGINTRTVALIWLASALAFGVLSFFATLGWVILVFKTPTMIACALAIPVSCIGVFSAIWYGLAIRWMDRNRAWPARR